ncbi:uncharacterized protein LOC143285753 [Babylonia areolata]|uniref:uncharacterized protein LOC143285753 n=1 Tax=Babylonia areolata TaxID=304850 RepID=UPI003FD11C33
MFTIPVISSNSRYSPDSSGMMHLNALNGSLSSSQRSLSSCSNCLPSYEEAVTNGPLFGLFNVNGGDASSTTNHRHQPHRHNQHHPRCHHHHDCHNHHHNHHHHIHFPQSYHSPNNNNNNDDDYDVDYEDDDGADEEGNFYYSPPTYHEVLFPGGTGSGTGSGRGPSRSPSPRPPRSQSDNAGRWLDVEVQGERLAKVTVSSTRSKSPLLSHFLPKSPRRSSSRLEDKQPVPTCTSKGGNGSEGKRKQGSEKSTLSVAKDKLYRVFSPMLTRKGDRHRSSSAKPASRKKTHSSADDENSEEEEMTSPPVRMCVAPGRSKGSGVRSGQFDDLKGHKAGKQHKSKSPHKHSHRTK